MLLRQLVTILVPCAVLATAAETESAWPGAAPIFAGIPIPSPAWLAFGMLAGLVFVLNPARRK